MADIANYHTFDYGARTGFVKKIHFVLMYTIHCIFPVLPINPLVNQDCEPTTPHKLETGTKPSV